MGKTPSRRGTRKAATSPTPAGSDGAASTEPLLTIRAQNRRKESVQQVITSGAAAKILKMANHWSYVLRVRTRWAHDADMREYFGTRAIADLKELDLSADTIQRLASFTHIEIEFHRWEQTGPDAPEVVDAASEIPWEYLLSAATRNAGRFEPLLVTRCLPNNTRVSSTRPPKRVLFVESAPGRIDAEYEFEDEESRIRAAVNATKYRDRMERARTLPLSKLAETVAKSNWEAIHVSGVDTHHAAWLIEGFYDDFKQPEVIDENNYLHDGMILRGDTTSEFPIRYNNLAPILLGSPKHPQVVTLNLYYSGARTSRELVRKGAYAALGFLDEIDDEFAERFFQEFYWAWCHHGKPISKAFIDAWQTMDGDRMHGTGIVIWFGSSIVGPAASQR